ncbi:transporter substrate-binding domain-containing protein [Paenibacillus albicereus]|uniref:Transporter substrate-binding domain-containing protein n=1 Tax=Paenibacillus albicereus TaxID=2726185 RepID=A0A6H2GU91_9BACL|nr:transporter substrate-binding domain-containing protein [Paenibacillus albicereus]QJC50718.1 transporter substrate-binding domain-containing protein [Paenibacillus albicereus]
MKKWTTAGMIAVLGLALAACGGNEAGGSGGDKLSIATDASYAPMESMDKDKIVGFDVDFLDAVMKEAGLTYELTNTGWDPLFADLEKGGQSAYDAAISAISISDDRKQTYDFSLPYFESVNMILTKQGAGVKDALELKDRKVAVQGATTAEELMKGIMGDGNTALKRFASNAEALLELEKGGVDAVVADFAVVQAYVQNNPEQKFDAIYDKTNFAPEYYGIMFPKGSELKEKVDAAVEKVRASDEYKEMYKKWIGVEPDTTDLIRAK